VRQMLLFLVVTALVPVAIALPYVGVFLWSWLSFMNPHREVFGAAYGFPFVYWVAIPTLIAWLASREPKSVLREPVGILMLLFLIWTCVTTVAALNRDWSFPYWERNAKSFVLIFAILGMVNSKTRIQGLVWIIAVSLGYYAVKGAGFILLTGGHFRVFGPDQSMISDNNSLSLALVMLLPLLNYLRLSSKRTIVSITVAVVMVLCVVTILGTYSRGGLFGLVVVSIGMWLRSRHKTVLTLGAAAFLILLPAVIPAQWYQRMATIQGYAEDQSFEGRVQAWVVSFNIAAERPLTGGGFGATQLDSVFSQYNTRGLIRDGTAAHSVYFEVLGDHGFVGLALYLLMVAAGWLNLRYLIRLSKAREDLHWAADLGAMIQVSFIGFLVVGSLLSMAYYDVFLALVALSACLRVLVEAEAAPGAQPSSVHWRRTPRAAAHAFRRRIGTANGET